MPRMGAIQLTLGTPDVPKHVHVQALLPRIAGSSSPCTPFLKNAPPFFHRRTSADFLIQYSATNAKQGRPRDVPSEMEQPFHSDDGWCYVDVLASAWNNTQRQKHSILKVKEGLLQLEFALD